ncbi:MAG: hypothetical protein K2Y51_11400 [Gammaproteobacteria bacterium]|nr:hypothetical protein [Gammaproteobacteria bacterium]
MFNSLSRQMIVSGRIASPASILTPLLSSIVAHLGEDLVGHAKAVAHVEGGVFHASTTGAESVIEVKTVGSPSPNGQSFRLDFMCVFHGLRYRKLLQAWTRSVDALVASGLHLEPLEITTSLAPTAPRSTLPIVGSIASSFLVLKLCCLIPLLWTVSGGGISFLQVFEPLEPFRPAFMALTVALLAAAYYSLYFGVATVARESVQRSVRQSRRILWIATAVFLLSNIYSILAPQQPHAMHHGAGHQHH